MATILLKASSDPVIQIEKITPGEPGQWRMALPYRNRAFLMDFHRLCGSQYRQWLPREEAWLLKPLERNHLAYIIDIARRHFPLYAFEIVEDPAPAYCPLAFEEEGAISW